MPFEGGFTFANFLADVLTVFFFVVWFWLLIIVFGDLFRRDDISGWAKVLWIIGLILFPFLLKLASIRIELSGSGPRQRLIFRRRCLILPSHGFENL